MPPLEILLRCKQLRYGAHLPHRNSSAAALGISNRRTLSATSRLAYPRKDSQDRESINTDATEYSKSGSDDGAAAQDRAAYEPGRTDPGEAKEEAGKKVSSNPKRIRLSRLQAFQHLPLLITTQASPR